MKLFALTTLLLASSVFPSQAAITFTAGSGGSPAVMNLTEDISFQFTTTITGMHFVQFLLKDVFSTNQVNAQGSAESDYAASGALTAQILRQGTTVPVEAVGYFTFGTFWTNVGEIGPRDFFGTFFFNPALTVNPGDVFTMKAGSVTSSRYAPTPDLAVDVDKVILTDTSGTKISGAIPEPTSITLGALGALVLLRRRR